MCQKLRAIPHDASSVKKKPFLKSLQKSEEQDYYTIIALIL